MTDFDFDTLARIFSTASSFLKKPLQDGVGKGITDLYAAIKNKIKKKSRSSQDTEDAIEKVEAKPDSKARQALLSEEFEPLELDKDEEILTLFRKLEDELKSLNAIPPQQISITQSGGGNTANVAGRDLYITDKKPPKPTTKFTPDERHIDGGQKKQIGELIEKLARKLATEEGKPNFGRAWNIFKAEMDVASYHEILKEDFDEAIGCLRRLNAMNRSKLRRRSPKSYTDDYFTAIYAKAGSLGWDKPRVYEFAREKLQISRKLSSLKTLGPNQLKKLSSYFDQEVRKHRDRDS